MSREDTQIWPWFFAAGVVGGGALVAWATLRRGGPPPVVPSAGMHPNPAQGAPASAQEALYSKLDIEAAARMLASENPRGSERLHIEQIWTQLRSRKRGQSLFDRITAGSGWGEQGKRNPPGRVRPVATTEPATPRFLTLAESVLRGERSSNLPGARKFFDPEVQDRAFAAAEAARKRLAAGAVLTDKERRLLGYRRTAQQVRAEWLKTSRYVGTIDRVEFFT